MIYLYLLEQWFIIILSFKINCYQKFLTSRKRYSFYFKSLKCSQNGTNVIAVDMDDTSVQVCFSSFFEVWRPVIQMDSFLCVLFKFFVRLKHSLIKLERENFWIRNLSTKKKWPRFSHDWVCIYEELFVIRDFIPIWNHQSTLLKNLSSIARSIYLLRKIEKWVKIN